MERRFPVIMGPTAGGKTRLAVAVALELRRRGTGAEIISADSVQIYRGMDIGSAKATPAERAGVEHHLIDVCDPADSFTVRDWLDRAEAAIADIRHRGCVPVVAGGTHLYIKALLEGLFEGPEPDKALRAELAALPPDRLRAEIEAVDPAAAERIHPADIRRTVRAIEVYRLTGTPISDHQSQWDRGRRPDAVPVCVRWPVEALNRRINARVRTMIELGLVEEAQRLAGTLGPQAREALGYAQIAAHLRGEMTLENAVERIKIETRRFAKNQRTWMRRLTGGAVPGEESQTLQKTCSRTLPGRAVVVEGPGLSEGGGLQIAVNEVISTILPSD